MNLVDLRLQDALKECEKHRRHLQDALEDLKPFLPFTVASMLSAPKEQTRIIDQLVYRFTKLQDTMGQKVFKWTLAKMMEDVEQLSFIDLLNRLEKLGLIPSALAWANLRQIRNALAHEYDDQPDRLVADLDRLIQACEDSVQILDNFTDRE